MPVEADFAEEDNGSGCGVAGVEVPECPWLLDCYAVEGERRYGCRCGCVGNCVGRSIVDIEVSAATVVDNHIYGRTQQFHSVQGNLSTTQHGADVHRCRQPVEAQQRVGICRQSCIGVLSCECMGNQGKGVDLQPQNRECGFESQFGTGKFQFGVKIVFGEPLDQRSETVGIKYFYRAYQGGGAGEQHCHGSPCDHGEYASGNSAESGWKNIWHCHKEVRESVGAQTVIWKHPCLRSCFTTHLPWARSPATISPSRFLRSSKVRLVAVVSSQMNLL